MTDLIIKSAVRNQIDDKNVSSDFYDALDGEVATVLENARKTVQPRDL